MKLRHYISAFFTALKVWLRGKELVETKTPPMYETTGDYVAMLQVEATKEYTRIRGKYKPERKDVIKHMTYDQRRAAGLIKSKNIVYDTN